MTFGFQAGWKSGEFSYIEHLAALEAIMATFFNDDRLGYPTD